MVVLLLRPTNKSSGTVKESASWPTTEPRERKPMRMTTEIERQRDRAGIVMGFPIVAVQHGIVVGIVTPSGHTPQDLGKLRLDFGSIRYGPGYRVRRERVAEAQRGPIITQGFVFTGPDWIGLGKGGEDGEH
jgi:hypothetical protein